MLLKTDYAHDDSNFFGCAGLRLAFDLTKSPDYKVVHAGRNSWKLFESLGCLVLVRRYCIGSNEFTIYEMRKGCSVWSIKYIVNTDDFMNPLPEGWSIWSIVWSIVLGEREEDSFLMINLSTKVVQYNLISKTLREIYDMGSNEIADDYLHGFILPYAMYDVGYKKLDYKVFEFIPSSASV
ncbi:hypothetical protein Tco_0884470 [Tanacetum coccineum]